MRFVKRNFLTLCCLTLLVAIGFCGDAWAEATGSTIMEEAQKKVRDVFTEVKIIIFILGGFGLVGVAFQAIMGKIKWVWVASLAVGLALLGAAGSIVEYATGSTSSGIETSFGNI